MRIPAIALSASVIAGLVFMGLSGAPGHFLLINAVALGIALLAMLAIKPPTERGAAIVAISCIVLLYAALLVGPDVDGIRRWVGFGPVQLHAAMLVLPALIAVLPRLDERAALAAILVAAAAISPHPDRASAIALLAGVAATALGRPSGYAMGSLAVSIAAVVICWLRPDPLEPVRFVEYVLADAWNANPAIALALGVAAALPLLAVAIAGRPYRSTAATLAGYLIASLFGPYPTPFIGYGASSIVGFGLAIALAAARRTVVPTNPRPCQSHPA